jgi:hypothetical protein
MSRGVVRYVGTPLGARLDEGTRSGEFVHDGGSYAGTCLGCPGLCFLILARVVGGLVGWAFGMHACVCERMTFWAILGYTTYFAREERLSAVSCGVPV